MPRRLPFEAAVAFYTGCGIHHRIRFVPAGTKYKKATRKVAFRSG